MRIAVCDDEKIFRDEITAALFQFFGRLELDCETFENGSQLVSANAADKVFDAVFLDIEMPVLDGMSAAAMLRKNGFTGPVIFLTSHTEFAMDGYEVAAFRFLSKPIDRDRLEKTLHDLLRELRGKKRLIIRYEGEEVILLLDDIRYIEAKNNSVSIVTLDREYLTRKKLADIETELHELSDSFVKIHRGYIVNLAHVKKQRGAEVFVTGDIPLPISRSLVSDFKRQLFQYVKSSAR